MIRMDFTKISKLFNDLEKTSKRLEKILILRDFLFQNQIDFRNSLILFDIIAGNYQRRINKKLLGISVKTVISVISFISKKSESVIEKDFFNLGDLGKVAEKYLKDKKQNLLFKFNKFDDLRLEDILDAFQQISEKTGSNSNKIKKEILSSLFFRTKNDLENLFLARLLIDDLRIGVSEGVLKEVLVNYFYSNILNVHIYCNKCDYFNLNMKNCFKCKKDLNLKNQEELISKKYKIVEYLEEKNFENKGLGKFLGTKKDNEQALKSILSLNKEKYVIKYENPRELYNKLLSLMEMRYNFLNSFEILGKEIKKDKLSILKNEIILLNPVKSMLGSRVNSFEESFEIVGKPAICDYKYDGLRMQIHNKKGEVKLFSRNLEDITDQFPEVVKFIKMNFPKEEFILDSECVGYDYNKFTFLPFQILSKRIMKKDKSNIEINVTVKVFDIMYLNGEHLFDEPYKKRREVLENLFVGRKIKQKINFDLKELKKLCQNFEY